MHVVGPQRKKKLDMKDILEKKEALTAFIVHDILSKVYNDNNVIEEKMFVVDAPNGCVDC